MSKSNDTPPEGQPPFQSPKDKDSQGPQSKSTALYESVSGDTTNPWEIPSAPVRPKGMQSPSDTMVLKMDDIFEEHGTPQEMPASEASILPPKALPPLDFPQTEKISLDSLDAIRSRPGQDGESTDPMLLSPGGSQPHGTVELDLNDMIEEAPQNSGPQQVKLQSVAEAEALLYPPSQEATDEPLPPAWVDNDLVDEPTDDSTDKPGTDPFLVAASVTENTTPLSNQVDDKPGTDPFLVAASVTENTQPPANKVTTDPFATSPSTQETKAPPRTKPFGDPVPPSLHTGEADKLERVVPLETESLEGLEAMERIVELDTDAHEGMDGDIAAIPTMEEATSSISLLDPVPFLDDDAAPSTLITQAPQRTKSEPPFTPIAPPNFSPETNEPTHPSQTITYQESDGSTSEAHTSDFSLPRGTTREGTAPFIQSRSSTEPPEPKTDPATPAASPLAPPGMSSTITEGGRPSPISMIAVVDPTAPPPKKPGEGDGVISIRQRPSGTKTAEYKNEENDVKVNDLTDMDFNELLTDSTETETFQIDEQETPTLPHSQSTHNITNTKTEQVPPAKPVDLLSSQKPLPTGQISPPSAKVEPPPAQIKPPQQDNPWPDVTPSSSPESFTMERPLRPNTDGPPTLFLIAAIGIGVVLMIIAAFMI